MFIANKLFKLSVFFGVVILFLVVYFGYLFFEPYLTREIITIEIVNKERFGSEPSKYLIFTPDEVFLNENNYYHEKKNADEIFPMFTRGNKYKVKVVGTYWPSMNRLRNIVKILEINGVPVKQEPIKID